MPAERPLELPGGGVPELDRVVEARRGEPAAVGADGGVPDLAGVADEGQRLGGRRPLQVPPLPAAEVGGALVEHCSARPSGPARRSASARAIRWKYEAWRSRWRSSLRRLQRDGLVLERLLGLPLLLGEQVVGPGQFLPEPSLAVEGVERLALLLADDDVGRREHDDQEHGRTRR